jgi:hypothetical protein
LGPQNGTARLNLIGKIFTSKAKYTALLAVTIAQLSLKLQEELGNRLIKVANLSEVL